MLKNQKIDDKFARINKIINDGIILYGQEQMEYGV